MSSTETFHASCVSIGGIGVLIEGASGAGKSDLALRLIDRGAALVSDDYTILTPTADGLIATPPATIAGQIEVRGIGIVAMPHAPHAHVRLLVTPGDAERPPERMPEPRQRTLAGVSIAEVELAPFEASAPIKVELALARTLAGAPA